MRFFEQSIEDPYILIDTYTVGRRVRVNHLAKVDDGYSAKYSWHLWPQAMYGDFPEGQEFIIQTPPYETAKAEEEEQVCSN
jgi:hypothetical protein